MAEETPKTKELKERKAIAFEHVTENEATQLGSVPLYNSQANSTFGHYNQNIADPVIDEFKINNEKPNQNEFPNKSISSYDFDQK